MHFACIIIEARILWKNSKQVFKPIPAFAVISVLFHSSKLHKQAVVVAISIIPVIPEHIAIIRPKCVVIMVSPYPTVVAVTNICQQAFWNDESFTL